MTDSAPPAKKAKSSTPVCRISAEERAKQFKEDLFVDSGVFCRLCEHSIDSSRVDSVEDHLKSKKHSTRKYSKQKLRETTGSSSLPSTSRQVTPSSIVVSKDLREEFVLTYIKLCTLADIPLHEMRRVAISAEVL